MRRPERGFLRMDAIWKDESIRIESLILISTSDFRED